jgi:xylono-1,5-lactonase
LSDNIVDDLRNTDQHSSQGDDMETLHGGFGLLEGPVWDPAQGLIVADTQRGGVYCLDRQGHLSTIVKHRRGIGGMVRHANGGLVVSGRNVAYKGPLAPNTVVLLENDPARSIVGFNDITTDRIGRIYAGALGFFPTESELSGIGADSKSAPLFLIDLDGSVRSVHPTVKLSNGLGFSPDGKLLYHADSGDRTVYSYKVQPDGSLTDRRPFITVADGLPDGLAIDAQGSIWLAVAHAGKVLVFSPDGSMIKQLDFPLPMTTSLCFGGDDMRDLYVVSGSDGTGRSDAGTIFRLRSDIPGVPMSPAQVAIPSQTAAADKVR